DRHSRYAIVRHHAPGLVSLTEKGIEPFQHALTHAARMPQPDRRPQDEDIRSQDSLAYAWPVIALTLVGCDAGLDVVIHCPYDFGHHAMTLQGCRDLV